MKIFKVDSTKQLKKIVKDGKEFVLLLNGGLRSSKYIEWIEESQKFYILNYIDSSEQHLTEQKLFTESNIGQAIKNKALIYEK